MELFNCRDIEIKNQGRNKKIVKTAVYETIIQYKRVKEVSEHFIRSPEEAFDYLKDKFDPYQEHLFVIALNTRNRVIATKLFSGHVNSASCDPRVLFKWLILNNAVSFIVAHNHPSGDPSPSPEDVEFTRRLKQAARILEIELLDHIIFTDTSFVSLSRERKI